MSEPDQPLQVIVARSTGTPHMGNIIALMLAALCQHEPRGACRFPRPRRKARKKPPSCRTAGNRDWPLDLEILRHHRRDALRSGCGATRASASRAMRQLGSKHPLQALHKPPAAHPRRRSRDCRTMADVSKTRPPAHAGKLSDRAFPNQIPQANSKGRMGILAREARQDRIASTTRCAHAMNDSCKSGQPSSDHDAIWPSSSRHSHR